MQPGQTITPGQAPASSPVPAQPAPQPLPPPAPSVAPAPQAPQVAQAPGLSPAQPPQPLQAQQPAQDTGWKFSAGQPQQSSTASTPSGAEVSWTASEFIAHSKGSSWYIVLFVVSIVITGGIYLTTHDIFTPVMVLLAALLFGIMASRKPRELEYHVSSDGMHIGPKFYPYNSFKSFSVMQEEGIESIWFLPLKRFMPGLSIYFAPDDGQKIVDVLSEYLPFEARELDPVDKLMHRIRF